jgi:hypothetical protein
MPGNDRFRLHNHQSPLPILPDLGQPHPKQAVCPSKSWTGTLPFHYGELLASSRILQCEVSDVAQRNQEAEPRRQEREHAAEYRG